MAANQKVSPKRIAPTQPDGATNGSSERECSSLDLLTRLRSGTLDAAVLAPADRQALVTLLSADGLSIPEIANLLKVTDRTVGRDRLALRESMALQKDPGLVPRLVGRLVAEAELCVQRIRRTARDPGIDPMIKIDAEHRCFNIVRDTTQALQRLGYLPTATQKLEADLTHRVGEPPTFVELQDELARLHALAADGAPHPALVELNEMVTRARIASQVCDVADTMRSNALVAESQP